MRLRAQNPMMEKYNNGKTPLDVCGNVAGNRGGGEIKKRGRGGGEEVEGGGGGGGWPVAGRLYWGINEWR